MIQNNLDPEVAEHPEELIVYGGYGKAARNWPSFDAILRTLTTLKNDETLLVQSGKPVGVMQTHEWAPRVLLANSNLVPQWATFEEFRRHEELGLIMYGQMTAGSWIYIGTQGIVQGTYETFVEMGRQHYNGSLAGKWLLTAARLRDLLGTQAQILDGVLPFLKPSGVLAYATCSLLRDENEAQVEAFVARHPAWRILDQRRFSPLQGGDGFFVARLTQQPMRPTQL